MYLTPSFQPGYFQLRIDKIIQEAPEVKTFQLVAETPVAYKAGQFLTFVFEHHGIEERRSYSLSSSPEWNEPLSITLKRVTNGKYSRPLIDLAKEGQILSSIQPAGQFTLPDDMANFKQLFLLAAGIGVTPIYSILKTALVKYPLLEIILVYSNTSTEDAVFYKKLLALQQQFPEQLKLELLFSSSANLTRARLSKWLLPQLLQVYDTGRQDEQLFYTCGPFPYMRMVVLSLEEQGYKHAQIRRELFDTTLPINKKEPPDKEAHKAFISLQGKQKEFLVKYPHTILQAAKANKITVPYSCETGKCGSCAVKCTSGKVWMSYNEVLTEKDIQAGKILTCTGHPVDGDICLELL